MARSLRRPESMTPEHARLQLLSQHDRIRARLAICTRHAKLYQSGELVGAELDDALGLLRVELAAHNQAETAIITELLHGPAAWGKLMIDRMLEEHVAEHAAFWELLSGTRAEVAGRIDDLADELDAHMAAEERTFLSPAALRDDVVKSRRG
jgi:hypothetical protein